VFTEGSPPPYCEEKGSRIAFYIGARMIVISGSNGFLSSNWVAFVSLKETLIYWKGDNIYIL